MRGWGGFLRLLWHFQRETIWTHLDSFMGMGKKVVGDGFSFWLSVQSQEPVHIPCTWVSFNPLRQEYPRSSNRFLARKSCPAFKLFRKSSHYKWNIRSPRAITKHMSTSRERPPCHLFRLNDKGFKTGNFHIDTDGTSHIKDEWMQERRSAHKLFAWPCMPNELMSEIWCMSGILLWNKTACCNDGIRAQSQTSKHFESLISMKYDLPIAKLLWEIRLIHYHQSER